MVNFPALFRAEFMRSLIRAQFYVAHGKVRAKADAESVYCYFPMH